MLLTPRIYPLSQVPDKGEATSTLPFHSQSVSWVDSLAAQRHAKKMLLVHQVGSVKVGEVVRYTITYTPSVDRILPTPSHLHVRLKNTSAIPLRAAYLHGPYNIYVAAYSSTFNPNVKVHSPRREGVPQFEPNLKAGGVWTARLSVPEDIRETSETTASRYDEETEAKSVTWIIEIASQIIFSASASVHYELLVGRDEKSLNLGFPLMGNADYPGPGQLEDHQQGREHRAGRHTLQPKGLFSKAIKLQADDTESLWNKPRLPVWEDQPKGQGTKLEYPDPGDEDIFPNSGGGESSGGHQARTGGADIPRKQKKVHLVIITHGLHGNLGADMLYLKEAIDATAKQAREDAKIRRAKRKLDRQNLFGKKPLSSSGRAQAESEVSSNPTSSTDTSALEAFEDSETDDEEVIVRGFNGNTTRTERGIKYLGKRLARHVLEITYPDQPFLPIKRSASRSLALTLSGQSRKDSDLGQPVHKGSSIQKEPSRKKDRAYKITSISFIGHSLGGLVQTYAVAYVQKHSPQFYDNIKPKNFIALASPFLGLSNENPMYVKFALDFGLVGRTGQDLGLTWRPPTLARSGWEAIVGGLGTGRQKGKEQDPQSKPLLRILPSGPAHQVLKRFMNRTVYANVVNDGIVPLRTSCLLFLDWRGLGRVEKARRENGVVGTMAAWGFAELTGATSSNQGRAFGVDDADSDPSDEGANTPTRHGQGATVPQPSAAAETDADAVQALEPHPAQFLSDSSRHHGVDGPAQAKPSTSHPSSPLIGFFKFLQPGQSSSSRKTSRVYSRGQTMPALSDSTSESTLSTERPEQGSETTISSSTNSNTANTRPVATRENSMMGNADNVLGPPKTTFFESAVDLMNPPLPSTEFLIDPSKRPRTIFHDRVYHPEDIPNPPTRPRSGSRLGDLTDRASVESGYDSGMKVEEKIARAYHKDMAWRKVLVRLEPDAHNNIIVRRMFANAYGWPVIKHVVDTHFSDAVVARTRDDVEPSAERAKAMEQGVSTTGEEVKPGSDSASKAAAAEAADKVPEIITSMDSRPSTRPNASRAGTIDSAQWDDAYFDGTTDEDEPDSPQGPKSMLGGQGVIGRLLRPLSPLNPPAQTHADQEDDVNSNTPKGTTDAEIADFLSASPLTHSPVDKKAGPSLLQDATDEGISLTASPPPLSPSSITEDATHVGLRSSFDGLGRPRRKSQPDGENKGVEAGVVEEVARLSSSGQ